MFSLNKIVKDGILEISFSTENRETKIYTITDAKGTAPFAGENYWTNPKNLLICG